MRECRGIVVAGVSGGSGKSVVAVGLTAAWTRAGQTVAPFKKGPDYIDAGWLQCAAGRPCYNLDPYLVEEPVLTRAFRRRIAGAELALVEGNRGLYDGVTAEGGYATAELALSLNLPVVLVVDCSKVTRTVAALVLGCMMFDRRLDFGGVILNQIATSRQERIVTGAIEQYTAARVLGIMPRLAKDVFPMRHLGMTPYQEYDGTAGAIDLLADCVRENIDLAAVEAVMRPVSATSGPKSGQGEAAAGQAPVRVGIIQDAAFQFYYPENLEAIERCGGVLVPVNALTDERLPPLDGLYIGGGFPETSAARLAANSMFRGSVKAAAEQGLPIYAECGGLIYLGTAIRIGSDTYPLVDFFPITFGMSAKPQAHGYSRFVVVRDNPFFPVGFRATGHEFRYSTISDWGGELRDLSLKMERGTGFRGGFDGLTRNNVLALYTHLHADGTPDWADRFVAACRRFRERVSA